MQSLFSATAFLLLFSVSTTRAQTLDSLAKSKGLKYFGSATDNTKETVMANSEYLSILGSEFGCITPTNGMKWDYTESIPGSFDFEFGDQIIDMAQANGQLCRGHNLVWHSQYISLIALILEYRIG
jgi:endo-1,4-beta-xylanase